LDQYEIKKDIDDVLGVSKPFIWFAWRVINFSRWLEINKEHLELDAE